MTWPTTIASATADLARPDETRRHAPTRTRSASPCSPARTPTASAPRWQEVQGGFVDEPQQAVQDADGLVADLMQRLAATFSEERSNLESQWDSGEDASTEDLRVALQRYRSFFDRLLSA